MCTGLLVSFNNYTRIVLKLNNVSYADSDYVLTVVMVTWPTAMSQLRGVIVKDGWDITSPDVHKKIVELLNGKKADVIMR